MAERLAAQGVRQRLVVRDAGRAPRLAGPEVQVANGYADTASMRRALKGAQRLLLIPAAESPVRVDEHLSAVRAAHEAGIEHLVYISLIRADEPTPFGLAADHGATEAAVRASGMDWTFLRMNLYLDFLPGMVGADGIIRGPAGAGRVAPVARDDLAEVAARVLVATEDHLGATYDITGPDELSVSDAARVMSEESSKPIRFVDETVAEAYESRRRHGEPWEVRTWVQSYEAVAAGSFAGIADSVLRLTGRPPLGLRGWLAGHPDSLDHVRGGGSQDGRRASGRTEAVL